MVASRRRRFRHLSARSPISMPDRVWAARRPEGPLPRLRELSLPDLLLVGLTDRRDEGPLLDLLAAVHASLDGAIARAVAEGTAGATIHASDLAILARRVDVAREMARRALGPGG